MNSHQPVWRGMACPALVGMLALVLTGCATAPPPDATPARASRLVVVEENAGRVSVLGLRKRRVVFRIPVENLPHEVELSANGQTAFVSNFGLRDYDRRIGTPGTTIAVIDLVTGEHLGHFELAGAPVRASDSDEVAAPHGVKLRPPDERELFVNAEVGDAMLVFDTETREFIRSFPLPPGTHNFVFSDDGAALWLMAAEGGVYRINPVEGDVIAHLPTETPARGLTWMPGGGRLLVSGRGEIYLVDAGRATIERRIGDLGVGQIIYSGVTPDGRLILAPAPGDARVVVIDVETGRVMRRLNTGKAPIRVIVDAIGESAYVANAEDDHVSVIDLEDWSMQELGPVVGPNGMALVP